MISKVALMCMCVAVALSAPAEEVAKTPEARALPALHHVHETDELGQYTLKYTTAEGTVVSEVGRLVPTPDGTGKVLVHEGDFTFVGDDGNIYVTKYKTSILGAYEVYGDHLPKSVPVPEVPKEEKPVEPSA